MIKFIQSILLNKIKYLKGIILYIYVYVYVFIAFYWTFGQISARSTHTKKTSIYLYNIISYM